MSLKLVKGQLLIGIGIGAVFGLGAGLLLKHFSSIAFPGAAGVHKAVAIFFGLLFGSSVGVGIAVLSFALYRTKDILRSLFAGSLFGMVAGGFAGVFFNPTYSPESVEWGLLCGSGASLAVAVLMGDPLRGFERMKPAKRQVVLHKLKQIGPSALPLIKKKASEIRQRGYQVAMQEAEFDFNPELELNAITTEIEEEHNIGIGGLMSRLVKANESDKMNDTYK